jgi:hypothetical protein
VSDRTAEGISACFRDTGGRLILKDAQGKEHHDVRPIRMFPISDPDGRISICDSQFNELLCIENIDAVPASSRDIFREELNRYMFTPIILQLTRAVPAGDTVRLSVQTDRGPADITVDTEDIYRLSGNRVLMKDVHGIRYLIPDWHAMNAQSRKILDMYL